MSIHVSLQNICNNLILTNFKEPYCTAQYINLFCVNTDNYRMLILMPKINAQILYKSIDMIKFKYKFVQFYIKHCANTKLYMVTALAV